MPRSRKSRRFAVLLRTVVVLTMLLTCVLPIGPATASGPSGPDGTAARSAAAAPQTRASDAKSPKYKPGEVIVRYAPKASAASRSAADRRAGAASVSKLGRTVSGLSKVKLRKGVSVEAAVAAYNKQPGVLYAEPNYMGTIEVVPDDPQFGDLWGLDNTGQADGVPDADIDAPEAWDTTTGSSDVVVAVIDTGVDYTHPDLAANIWTNPNEIPNGVDDDGNGYVDDIHGIDTVNRDSDPMDDYGHGTHCAGTIGAVGNNGVGVAGVNWNVKIMAVKWIGADGWGETDGAIEALEYADLMGADLSSNSWHIFEYSQAMYDAIAAIDSVQVFAAGNDSMNTDVTMNIPSAYDLPNILAVGASNRFDEMAWFSNYGLKTVDVFAPGEDVLSTVPGEAYDVYSGTSMATPHVAGVAALLLSVNPTASWQTLKLAIMGAAEPKPAFAGKCLSGGRLNADLALDAVVAAPGTLSGTVLSPEGLPVADAAVSVGSVNSMVTGPDGAFLFEGVVPGTQALVVSHPDYLTKVLNVAVLSEATTVQDVQLQLAGKISGTVSAASGGALLEGIQVTAYSSAGEWWEPIANATTAADGTYTIGGLTPDPMGYRVEFSDPSMAYVSQCYDNKPTIDVADDVFVDYGVTTSGIDAALQEYGRIAGTVTAASSGEAVAGVWVTAYRLWEGQYWEPVNGTEVGADGTYVLGGLETGTYRVEFVDPSGTYAYEFYDGVTKPSQAASIDVTLGSTTSGIDATLDLGGKIAGTVTAASDGAPLADVYVNVYRNNGGSWEPLMMGAMTASDGTYLVGGLPTGSYRVEFVDWSGVYASEFYNGKPLLRMATAVGVRAGATTRSISASLDLAGKISGTVTAASDGTPLAGVWVSAYRKIGEYWESVTGAETGPDGSYTIEGMPTGTYRVGFEEPSGEYVSEFYDGKPTVARGTNVGVTAGFTTADIDATLETAGKISGTVTSAADGAPLEYVFAIAYRYNAGSWVPFWGTETASDGTYTIGALPTGTYRVEFFDWSGTYANEFFDNQPSLVKATNVAVTLGATTSGIDAALDPGGMISGTVTAASDGAPLEFVYAMVYRNNGGTWEPFFGAETASDGTYTIGGLATGTYRVEFYDWTGRYANEFFDGKPSLVRATDVRVTAGSATTGIDATLEALAPGAVAPMASAGFALPDVTLSVEGNRAAVPKGSYFIRDTSRSAARMRPTYRPGTWTATTQL